VCGTRTRKISKRHYVFEKRGVAANYNFFRGDIVKTVAFALTIRAQIKTLINFRIQFGSVSFIKNGSKQLKIRMLEISGLWLANTLYGVRLFNAFVGARLVM
jgi:hypothetical protein